jgi:glycosyltransferase involved in cell wall biosynthesis
MSPKDRLHVCYVEPGYPHPHGGGGAGTYVQLTARELVKRGWRASVIAAPCPECAELSVDEGVTVYRPFANGNLHWYVSKIPLLKRNALAVRYIERSTQLHRLLRRLQPNVGIDLIEFSDGGDFWFSRRALVPYVVHLHGSGYTFLRMSHRATTENDWRQRRLELRVIEQAALVISPSQALLEIVKSELARCERALAGPTVVLPYPLDSKLLAPEKSNDEQNKQVLFAARNDPVKGADVLLRAIPSVRGQVPNAQFHFFGFEPNGSTLPQGVDCHPFLPKSELLRRYSNADLCVVPSLWDNSPNTVYEAMAAAKAVVATRVGGIPELVIDGETGLLVEPGDASQLADAIVKLISNDSLRRQMGRRGQERIKRLSDLETNVDRRMDLYNQVLRNSALRNVKKFQSIHTQA